jgi:hypothetical protein
VRTELAIGKRCTLNSDCTSPNVCVFGRCHAECKTSDDCENGERCVQGAVSGSGVCQLAQERDCASSAGCPGEQVCGVDGECRDLCKGDDDCLGGQVCTQATCADPEELGDDGKLPESEAHLGEGQPCQYNSDCPGELLCVSQLCGPECVGDKDCDEGHRCVASHCELECSASSDCAAGDACGPEGHCVEAACTRDEHCLPREKCLANACTPPLFYTDGESIAGLSASGGLVYFVRGGRELVACDAVAGCATGTVLGVIPDEATPGSSAALYPPRVAVHGSTVVFTDGRLHFLDDGSGDFYQNLFLCPVAGCPDPLTPLQATNTSVAHLALDDTTDGPTLYAAVGGSMPPFDAALIRCKIAPSGPGAGFTCEDGGPDGPFVVTLGTHSPLTVRRVSPAQGDEQLFAIDPMGRLARYDLATCPTGSCAPTLLSPVGSLLDLELDEGTGQLYWLTSAAPDSALVRFSLDAQATELVLEEAAAMEVATDAGRVYLGTSEGVWGFSPPP